MGTLAKAKSIESDDPFYKVKVATAQFYFARVLPRTVSHREMMAAGADTIMSLADADFDAVCNS